jgi:hypothetical protein
MCFLVSYSLVAHACALNFAVGVILQMIEKARQSVVGVSKELTNCFKLKADIIECPSFDGVCGMLPSCERPLPSAVKAASSWLT